MQKTKLEAIISNCTESLNRLDLTKKDKKTKKLKRCFETSIKNAKEQLSKVK